MQEQCKTFEELIFQAADFLRSKLSHAENTVKLHLQAWRKIKRYMDSQQIDHFDLAVGKDYLLKKKTVTENLKHSLNEKSNW